MIFGIAIMIGGIGIKMRLIFVNEFALHNDNKLNRLKIIIKLKCLKY